MKISRRAFNTLALGGTAGAIAGRTRVARADQTSLTWFMWSSNEENAAVWRHIAGMVTDVHPDITVEFQTTTFPDYWTRLPTLAASGQMPDIVSLQSMRAPGFASLMEPLDDLIAADGFDIDAFDSSIVQGLSRDGRIFALPYDFGPWVMYYNHDRFEAAGVPVPRAGWTEAEFMDAARALTGEGKYGFALSVPDAFISFARSKGASYLTADGTLDLANDGMKAAFEAYSSLVTDEQVAPLFPASGTSSSSVANGRFTAGDIAMYVDGPWQLLGLKDKVDFTIGIAPLPAREAGSISVSAGSGFGIATTSAHKEAAWKAIQVMTGPAAEQFLAEAGRAFAARKDQQVFWYNTAAADVVGADESIPAALQTAEAYVTTPEWATVSANFERYAPVAFSGAEPAGDVLETIQEISTE